MLLQESDACCRRPALGVEGNTLLLFTGLEMVGGPGLSECACYLSPAHLETRHAAATV